MGIIPYLMFQGNCEEALNFYKKALGGEIKDLNYFEGSPAEDMAEDKKQVMHATFQFGENVFMASDGCKDNNNSQKVHLSMNFTDGESIKKTFEALSEGANITMPLQDTFWGATFGMLTDKYGINWMFNYDKPGAKP